MNQNTLNSLADDMDNIMIIIARSPNMGALKGAAFNFQVEQEASSREYHDADITTRQLVYDQHLQKVVCRMIELAMTVLQHTLQYTKSLFAASSPASPCRRSSSVDDLDVSDEIDINAQLMNHASSLVGTAIIAEPPLRQIIQRRLTEDHRILDYLEEIFSASEEVEGCFPEGYKATHMRIFANLTYCNPTFANFLVTEKADFVRSLLSRNTHTDMANIGLSEWKQFSIRNIAESGGGNEFRQVMMASANKR